MSTASVTNTFVNAATADADEVNTNFSDLVTFLNGSVVHTDGSKAFTGVQTGVTPTSDAHLATKAYVDNIGLGETVKLTSVQTIATGATGAMIDWDATLQDGSAAYWAAGAPTRLTVPGNGWYLIWGQVFWSTSEGTGGTYRKAIINVSGSTRGYDYSAPAAGLLQQVTCVNYCTTGQYAELQVIQDSGADKDVSASGTAFGIARLSLKL